MQEILNKSRLNDASIKLHTKLKTSVYLQKQTYKKIDSICTMEELNSRNEVIEKAIDFYFAYVNSELSQDFLCGVYGRKIDGAIGTLANRISRLQFKQSVELDMITRLLSSNLEISKEKYERLRKTSVDSVKKNNGSINIYDAALNIDKE